MAGFSGIVLNPLPYPGWFGVAFLQFVLRKVHFFPSGAAAVFWGERGGGGKRSLCGALLEWCSLRSRWIVFPGYRRGVAATVATAWCNRPTLPAGSIVGEMAGVYGVECGRDFFMRL